jgi:hypothetical protein
MSLPRIAAIVTFLVALGAAPPAHAVVRELGVPEPFPVAGCPDNCQAVGQVSGFQQQIGATKAPYRSGRPGKIVAFTIRLGRPNAEQTQFFQNFFGGPPSARLSVLRSEGKRRHTLVGQSEVFQLGAYLGSTPSFALARPLTVQRGYKIALTVPTWVPAFTVGLGDQYAWRSSRPKSVCDATTSEPSAQQTRGSLRTYGCFYRDARLLYSATFVPTPSPTTGEEQARSRGADGSGASSGSTDTRTGGTRPD